MDELQYNRKYHVAHLLGTEFEKRMYDVYIGLNNNERPPFLEDIFNESTQAQALMMLEQIKMEDQILMFSNFDSLYNDVWNDEEYAKIEVLQTIPGSTYQDIFRDIFTFLNCNYMSFLIGDITRRKKEATLVNTPVMQVW